MLVSWNFFKVPLESAKFIFHNLQLDVVQLVVQCATAAFEIWEKLEVKHSQKLNPISMQFQLKL